MEDNQERNADQLARVYVKIRDKKRELEKEVEDLDAKLKLISTEMLDLCKEQGATTIRTEHGTISRRTTKQYFTTDWDSLFNFIKERDAFSLVQQRIHNTNMAQFLEENPDDYPPGLQAEVKHTIVLTKR